MGYAPVSIPTDNHARALCPATALSDQNDSPTSRRLSNRTDLLVVPPEPRRLRIRTLRAAENVLAKRDVRMLDGPASVSVDPGCARSGFAAFLEFPESVASLRPTFPMPLPSL